MRKIDDIQRERRTGKQTPSVKGIALPRVIDPLGRVLEPSPYNIPQRRHQITRFAAKMLIAMVDIGEINEQTLGNQADVLTLRRICQEVINSRCGSIYDQPHPNSYLNEWTLYEPGYIKQRGEKLPLETVYPHQRGYTYFREQRPQLSEHQHLVAVVTVNPSAQNDQWTVAFDATSEYDYYRLADIQPCGLYDIKLYIVNRDDLVPLLAKIPPPFG
jgi:hypothetical protein